ncbi:MAG TPA: trypsin-like peptidase domain-containing protein [Gemmatimonadales bacterium]|nr:trypsin-like peptidase domain-containing protein [Gemmatimonadales bacterium]
MKAQFRFLSGARAGQVEAFRKAYIGLGRHPLSDVRFDTERDLDVSSRHAAIVRKAEGFVLQDLGSRNGTFVNGRRIDGDTILQDGDVIGFGPTGPALEFHAIAGESGEQAAMTAAEGMAQRASTPRELFRATPAAPPAPPPPPRRSSTAVRIAIEVAQLRRTTKVLIGLLIVTAGAFGWLQWEARQRARELIRLQARADSLVHSAQQLSARFQSELRGVRDALAESQAETARLRRELAGSGGDATSMARLRNQLDDAERRQRALMGAVGGGVDYRAISHNNQDAVAIVIVEFSDGERFSGTAFAVDSNGTLVTNKHVLLGEDGTRTPRRIAVIFSGSVQAWPGELVGVSPETDVGVLRVRIKGGTPRVTALARSRQGIERGDPVAIIGYPLGFDLPMEAVGQRPIAEPTLTVGTVSKVLTAVVQVDGYGAPGSSGSPIFDREGRVIAVLYGGQGESQGKIIFALPAYIVADYLKTLGLLH